MFEPNFNDLDAVFFQKKHHRRIQRVRITLKAVLLWVKVFYFGLGDFLRAKKFLTRPPSVISIGTNKCAKQRAQHNKTKNVACDALMKLQI
jgi:hypothetical protein